MQDLSVHAAPRAEKSRAAWVWACAVLWAAAVVGGLSIVMAYDNTPGAPGASPSQWPADARLEPASGRPTLILLAHPQCSCTRASLAELAEVLARAESRPTTYVLFLKPDSFTAGWEQTDLWRSAASLPGVTVLRDDEGVEARRFGAITSGQTVLYDAGGRLQFSGGITGARGHAGDNAGRAALVALLNHGQSARSSSSVFGCPLFSLGT